MSKLQSKENIKKIVYVDNLVAGSSKIIYMNKVKTPGIGLPSLKGEKIGEN